MSIILANTFVINSSFIKITLLYFFINCTTGGLFLISLNDLSGEINSNLIANKRIAVKALTATIPTGFGTATAQATFTIPKTCPLLEIEYGATGGYYYSCELFIDDVSQGAGGYQSRTVSKTNVPAGTVIKLVAKRDNPDNLESNVSAYASIAYIHNV